MGTKEKALEKIDNESKGGNPNSESWLIAGFLRTWVQYDPEAAELILDKNKRLMSVYSYMHKKAEENNKQMVSGPETSMAWIMEYYGEKDPIAKIEGGLMYACAMDQMKRSEKYEVTTNQQAPADLKPSKPAHRHLNADDLF